MEHLEIRHNRKITLRNLKSCLRVHQTVDINDKRTPEV